MAFYLDENERVAGPIPGRRGYFIDADGVLKELRSNGLKIPVGAPAVRDMRSIVRQSAADVLPAGFAEFWTDLTGEADHGVSASLNPTSYASVSGEPGGKRRLTTQATGPGVAEIMPNFNSAGVNAQLATMINPKTSAWYVEGRAAIETHGANSILLPCSIAATTGGVMTVPGGVITGNTFCGFGLVGTGFTGGSNSLLSFIAVSGGTFLVQNSTIPWVATMQAYSLHFDGAGTITARAFAPDGSVSEWTTTNLNNIFAGTPGVNVGFHPNQWLMATDATVTTMLVDYLYGAGPRI